MTLVYILISSCLKYRDVKYRREMICMYYTASIDINYYCKTSLSKE